jgi:two-component system nitrogen regulation sensor histidine kinase GlnL
MITLVDKDSAFRRIMAHQYTAVVVLDGSCVVEHINSAAELLLVRSEKQLLGHAFDSLFAQPDEIRSLLASVVQEGASVSVRSASWQMQSRELLTLDFIVSPVMDRNQIHLIVEMVPADRSVRISRDEGRVDHTETSRHLVRGLAHEIKNPLGGIRGAAQLLASELPSDELQEYTRVIIKEADRLRNLVDRLLGSHQMPAFSQLNIHQVLERVLALIKAEAGDRVTLIRDYDPSIPEFLGDEAQLIQVFLNIARNALQALSESDQPAAVIRFRSRTVRQYTIRQKRHRIVARIDVIDNGPGIERDMLEKIFYPMISGRASGTGLGLSLVQQLVELHNGSVACESEAGQTLFTVHLPLETIDE